MLIIPILDGYSASITDTNMYDVVTQILLDYGKDTKHEVCYERSKIFDRKGNEKILRFIFEHESEDNTLLCVAKSLGAKRMINNVLNRLALRKNSLNYKRVYCFTIDPNWPLWYDLTPNLNNRKLTIKYPVDNFINVYVHGKRHQQCGAKVLSKYIPKNQALIVHNVPVYKYDHYSIVGSPNVRERLGVMIRKVVKDGYI